MILQWFQSAATLVYVHNEHYNLETSALCRECAPQSTDRDLGPVLLRWPRWESHRSIVEFLHLKLLICGFHSSSLKSLSVCPGLKGWADALLSPCVHRCISSSSSEEKKISFVGREAAPLQLSSRGPAMEEVCLGRRWVDQTQGV